MIPADIRYGSQHRIEDDGPRRANGAIGAAERAVIIGDEIHRRADQRGELARLGGGAVNTP